MFEAGGSEDGHNSHVKSFFGALSIFVQSGTCHGGNLKKKQKFARRNAKITTGTSVSVASEAISKEVIHKRNDTWMSRGGVDWGE